MDYIEYKILSTLQKNARLTNLELAKQVGLSASPCLRRVKALENTGIISGYSAIIDQNKVDLSVNVFVQVSLERQSEEGLEVFEEKIIEYNEVMEAYLMTGEADYLLRIVVKDLQTYEKFLKENLTRIPGISSIRSYFSLKQVTRKYNLPIINPKKYENKR
ncbi:MAG TPA: Lrp/AsnC family transcriptional regulator [Alphaproteobacteria bacterium]|jgi:DNA-binding Lrp family transcriptional regulator|nr:Lrp/AsnC family transcriptional regulator [Alphaproteobacteria bacterium]